MNQHQQPTVVQLRFADDGTIPNSPLPALLRRAALPAGQADLQLQRFAVNGWTNGWQNGIYDYHHFHSTAHEVLGVVRGSVRVCLGGPHGDIVDLQAGDVLVIPAGVGHRCDGAEGDLLVVGAYADGRSYDICTGDAGQYEQVRAAIREVPLPSADPVDGEHGPLGRLWASD
jgi:uncharacterized protein YjlB